jgi:bifunctional non-homologous end joining protein LigD
MPLPRWIEPQLCKLATKAPSGAQWAHEIKLDGYRMAARIENGWVKLLTRSGLDWTPKYPATAAAFAKLKVTTAYLDGELCGVQPETIPSVRSLIVVDRHSFCIISVRSANRTHVSAPGDLGSADHAGPK